MDLKTSTERLQNGLHLVTVSGESDLHTVPELERTLLAALDAGATSLVVDLTACTFIDSTTLGVLLRTRKRLEPAGGRVALVSTNRQVLRVLEVSGLDRTFAVFRERDAALAG